jgi:hypothetical protein
MVAPGRVELPTFGLGNRCSIHLSYGAVRAQLKYLTLIGGDKALRKGSDLRAPSVGERSPHDPV